MCDNLQNVKLFCPESIHYLSLNDSNPAVENCGVAITAFQLGMLPKWNAFETQFDALSRG